ncbi:MAG: LysR family transcriptional regulator [Roseovarius sp.]
MFEWSDIRILLAVADAGSTLGAARKLGLNQTTVSRRVQALEHATGLTLFERDTRGYALTTNGRALLEPAREMAAAADHLSKRAKALVRGCDGKIRISAAADCQAFWVNPVITAYKNRHEGIVFEVDDSNHQVDLAAGEADLAIRATEHITDENLITRKLGNVVWAAFCSTSYAEAHGAPASMAEMPGHKVAFYSQRMAASIETIRLFAEHLDPAQITHTFNSTVSLANMLSEGEAVGFLPRITAHGRPGLVECFTQDTFRQNVWLVTSSDSYQVPLIRDFMAFTGAFGLKDGVTLV